MVRQSGGLDPLVNMARNPKTKEDKPLLAAVTGAIWKTAISPENVERLDQLKTVEVYVMETWRQKIFLCNTTFKFYL